MNGNLGFFSRILSILIVLFVGLFPSFVNISLPTWAVFVLFAIALLLFILPVIRDIKSIGKSIQACQAKASSATNTPLHQEWLTLKSDRLKSILFLMASIVFFILFAMVIVYFNIKTEKLNIQIEQMKHYKTYINQNDIKNNSA